MAQVHQLYQGMGSCKLKGEYGSEKQPGGPWYSGETAEVQNSCGRIFLDEGTEYKCKPYITDFFLFNFWKLCVVLSSAQNYALQHAGLYHKIQTITMKSGNAMWQKSKKFKRHEYLCITLWASE